MATIADVARKTGVSVSITWHVLNRTPRVALDPAHPLEAAAEAFGGRLNIVARSRRGLRVPKDLSVIGFDDSKWTYRVEPRLTLIAQPSPEIGRCTAFLLRERIAVPLSSRHTIGLKATIVERESCCRPR